MSFNKKLKYNSRRPMSAVNYKHITKKRLRIRIKAKSILGEKNRNLSTSVIQLESIQPALSITNQWKRTSLASLIEMLSIMHHKFIDNVLFSSFCKLWLILNLMFQVISIISIRILLIFRRVREANWSICCLMILLRERSYLPSLRKFRKHIHRMVWYFL